MRRFWNHPEFLWRAIAVTAVIVSLTCAVIFTEWIGSTDHYLHERRTITDAKNTVVAGQQQTSRQGICALLEQFDPQHKSPFITAFERTPYPEMLANGDVHPVPFCTPATGPQPKRTP